MPRESQQGLTLLEVLVALVILAVALTAVIKATTENIRATAHLREKTLATWVGLNAFNQARLELTRLPSTPEYRTVKETQLGQDWEWRGYTAPTRNARILEAHVQVFHLPEHRLVTELKGYLYAN